MGHSSMDPAFHELRPWNEGRLLGAKQNSLLQDWIDSYRQTLLDREELKIDTQSVITGS